MDLELEKKRAYAREYYHKHKEKIRASQKKYYQSHKDKFREYYRTYAIKNYARILKLTRSNIERYIKEYPDYYKEKGTGEASWILCRVLQEAQRKMVQRRNLLQIPKKEKERWKQTIYLQ